MDLFGWILSIGITVAGGIFWFVRSSRCRRAMDEGPAAMPASAPPHDWSPVQLSYLWNWGEPKPRDIGATVLDLIARGALILHVEQETVTAPGDRPIEDDWSYLLRRAPECESRVTPAERFLIDRVLFRFSEASTAASLRQIMAEGARGWMQTCCRCDEWLALAKQEAQPVALEGPEGKRDRAQMAWAGIAMLVLLVPLACLTRSLGPFLLLSGAGLLIGSTNLRRPNDEALAMLARWRGYKEHLAATPGLATMPLHELAAGGRPLIYAVTLNLAHFAVRQLEMLYPDVHTIDLLR